MSVSKRPSHFIDDVIVAFVVMMALVMIAAVTMTLY
jgi:hypothetical protein